MCIVLCSCYRWTRLLKSPQEPSQSPICSLFTQTWAPKQHQYVVAQLEKASSSKDLFKLYSQLHCKTDHRTLTLIIDFSSVSIYEGSGAQCKGDWALALALSIFPRQSPPWRVWSSSFFIIAVGVTMLLGNSGSPCAIHDYHGQVMTNLDKSWSFRTRQCRHKSHGIFKQRKSSFTTVNWFHWRNDLAKENSWQIHESSPSSIEQMMTLTNSSKSYKYPSCGLVSTVPPRTPPPPLLIVRFHTLADTLTDRRHVSSNEVS